MRYDCVVVGAGPAGSRAAYVLALAGWRVLVLEEHPAVGTPVHCTGIVGQDCIDRFSLPDDLVQARFSRFLVVAPSGTTCDLPGIRPTYALDRRRLDEYLASVARKAGAEIVTGVRVLRVHQTEGGVRVQARADDAEQMFDAKSCVLACGAMSNLPKRCGLPAPASFYHTVQSDFEADGAEGAEIFLGRRYSQGSFAWTVRTGQGRAKAGLITPRFAREGYVNLLESARQRIDLGPSVCRPRFRRMPMGLVSRATQGRIAAVGDAAGQIKTTTGGGIYFGMLCADLLANSLIQAYRQGEVCAESLAAYDAAWKAAIGGEVMAGVVARRLFQQFEDEEINRLVTLCGRDDVQETLARTWHFDFHGSVLQALAGAPGVQQLAVALASRSGRWQRFIRMARHASTAAFQSRLSAPLP